MNEIDYGELSPRVIGFVYLFYFVTAILTEVFMKGIVVAGDAAATANHILANEGLYKLGIATGLIATAGYLALTALFYELFKLVNRSVSFMAALFSLLGCALQAFERVFQLVPLMVLGEKGKTLGAFNPEQLQALALLSLKARAQGDNVSLVFFAAYCLLLGYLIFKSKFLPRWLGLLMGLAGLGWLTFLSPPFAMRLSPFIQIVGMLAEVSLMVWLLAFGVKLGEDEHSKS